LAIRLDYSDEILNEIRRLRRKYRQVGNDLKTFTEQLERGETPGDRLQDLAPFVVYKARVKNSVARKGKSGGYRVIYYIKTEDRVVLLTMYPKAERDDISADDIRRIITQSRTPPAP